MDWLTKLPVFPFSSGSKSDIKDSLEFIYDNITVICDVQYYNHNHTGIYIYNGKFNGRVLLLIWDYNEHNNIDIFSLIVDLMNK